jgi:regulator of telomere elongation helicase 1
MPTYDISGVPVEFPYDAYECQLAYMGAVIKALSAGDNALLESPTGTGKTLCLLCAALGWRRHQEKAIDAARMDWEPQADPDKPSMAQRCPRIWYASRTHSQIKQVVKELKRTTYRPSTVVLGSREHFCIHATVSKYTGARQNAMCKRSRDDNKCPFYVGYIKGQGKKLNTDVMDIEEIVSTCSGSRVCPFYKTRDDAKDVELLFIPYDYLINPATRESLQVTLKNSIVIFDEGHNIERSCESAASFELGSKELAGAIDELTDASAVLESEDTEEMKAADAVGDMSVIQALAHINLLKSNLLGLEDAILAETLEKDPMTERQMRKAPGSHILQIFAKGSERSDGITAKDIKRVSMVIQKSIAVLTYSKEGEMSQTGGLYLDKLQAMLAAAFKAEPSELDKHFQMLLYEDEEKRGTKRKANVDFFSGTGAASERQMAPRTLCLWCFSCSVALCDIQQQGVRSFIITSGTLSPLEGTADAFGVPFPVVLQNSHVIDVRKQLWGGVLTAGPNKIRLDSSFQNRDEPAYLNDLGQTVARFAACVPDGVLLAFQSYAQKESVLKAWRQTGIFDEIQKHKPVFEEPHSHMELKAIMGRFNEAVIQAPTPTRPTGGAMLVAVCRGKLCEGIDFTDRQCRLVIMVGVPYPSKNDLRVMLKQNFLDTRGAEGDGRKWYVREAIRAVNQTVGRVIRHKDDFGGVLLCDDRYARDGRLGPLAAKLPSWLLSGMSVRTSCDVAVETCQKFFGSHGRDVGSLSAAKVGPSKLQVEVRPERTGVATPQQQPQQQQQQQQQQPTPVSSGSTQHRPVLQQQSMQPVLPQQSMSHGRRMSGGGTPLSALGAIFKQQVEQRRLASAAMNAQTNSSPAVSSTANAGTQSASSSDISGNPKPTQQGISRNRAVFSGNRAVFSAPVGKDSMKLPNMSSRLLHVEGLDRQRWLQSAEQLVPRQIFERMCIELEKVYQQADTIMSDAIRAGSSGEDVEKRLLSSMSSVVQALLPEFDFDTYDETKTRHALVKECGTLLPRMVRSLWRQCVEDRLKATNKPAWTWGR